MFFCLPVVWQHLINLNGYSIRFSLFNIFFGSRSASWIPEKIKCRIKRRWRLLCAQENLYLRIRIRFRGCTCIAEEREIDYSVSRCDQHILFASQPRLTLVGPNKCNSENRLIGELSANAERLQYKQTHTHLRSSLILFEFCFYHPDY